MQTGKRPPLELSEEEIDKARLWVVNAHVNRINGLSLRWTRCKYEAFWSQIPADMRADAGGTEADDHHDADAAAEVSRSARTGIRIANLGPRETLPGPLHYFG